MKKDFVSWKDAEVPEKTETYQPISHKALISLIEYRAELQGYTIISNSVSQNTSGTRIAGILTVQRAGVDDFAMMIAYTNSYDKTLAIKLASGGSVFVCENGMIVGDVVTMRMHTKNLYLDLVEMIDGVIRNLENVWMKMVNDVRNMKKVPMSKEDTAKLYGVLFIVDKVITSTQLNIAVRELNKPSFVEFQPQNLWSSYNHVTWALKNAQPDRKLDCLKKLHERCTEMANDYIAITCQLNYDILNDNE